MSNTINSQIRSNQYQSSNANTESVSGAQNIGYLEGRSNTQIGSDQLLTTRTTVNNDPKNYIDMQPIYDKFDQICSRERLAYPHDEELKTAYKELKIQIEQVKVENIDVKDAHGRTLLHYASQLKQPDIAEQLIEKGADINSQDYYKKTPLHYASEAKFEPSGSLICSDVFDLLLLKEADPNIQDNKGNTPLHVLCSTIPENRCYSLSKVNYIINKLIEYGANINAKNKLGNTPLTLIISMMTAAKGEFIRDIINYYSAIAIQLIECGVNINIKNNNDDAPLHIAMRILSSKRYIISSINENLIKSLITLSEDINAKDKEGNTPLHEAIGIEDSSLSLIFMLLDKGANLNIKNNLGNTPLHKAILALTIFKVGDEY